MTTLMRQLSGAVRALMLNLAGNGTGLQDDGHPRNRTNAQDMASPNILLLTD